MVWKVVYTLKHVVKFLMSNVADLVTKATYIFVATNMYVALVTRSATLDMRNFTACIALEYKLLSRPLVKVVGGYFVDEVVH